MTTSYGLLDGKVVVLAGYGPGLGAALASRAVQEGARLVLASRTAEKLEAAAKDLRETGAEVLVVHAGQHAHGDAARRVQHVAQPAEPGGVRQAEVEQHAVHRTQPRARRRHVRRDLEVDRRAGLGQQFLDEERVAFFARNGLRKTISAG